LSALSYKAQNGKRCMLIDEALLKIVDFKTFQGQSHAEKAKE
jgi:hypothetical protein